MSNNPRYPPYRVRYDLFYLYTLLRDNDVLKDFIDVITNEYYDTIILVYGDTRFYKQFLTLARTGLKSYHLIFNGNIYHYKKAKDLYYKILSIRSK